MADSNREIQTSEISLNCSFRTEFPIPKGKLRDIFQELNWNIPHEEGPRLLAMTQNMRCIYDGQEGVINMKTNSLEFIRETYESLFELLFDEAEISDDELEHVELSTEQLIMRGESTMEVFEGLYDPYDLPEPFEGDPTAAGTRILSSVDYDVDAPDVYDIQIDPYIRNLNYYHVDIVYRKKEFEQIKPIIVDYSTIMNTIIDNIEEESGVTA